MENEENCTNCFYGREHLTNGKTEIRCRRYPPQLVQLNHGGEYPLVSKDNWCGEYKKVK